MFSRELSLPGLWSRYMAPTYSVGPVGVTEPTTIAAHPTFLPEPSLNSIERDSAPRGTAKQCRAGLLIAPLVAYDRAGFRPGDGAVCNDPTSAAQKDEA